jgi:SAM-dependent methyltransferase
VATRALTCPRCLDIGPGSDPIPGFETLDVVKRKGVDHVSDCHRLPFPGATFEIIHASHVIEHTRWMDAEDTLREWARVLMPGGRLEVWTVNAYKLAKALVEYEETSVWSGPKLGAGTWRDDVIHGDPYLWVSGRLFCYPKLGLGLADPYWHHAMFTPKSLMQGFRKAGLVNIRELDPKTERRGRDHKWINMGVVGEKPTC